MITKKRLWLFGLLVLLLILFKIVMLNQSRMIQFIIDGENFSVNLEIDNKAEVIHPWYDEEKELYYFFLPSCILDRKLYFDNAEDSDIVIDNSIVGKKSHLLWEPEKIYAFEINGSIYQITFMKSENIPALFMETDSGSMDYVNSNKALKERGRLTVIGADRELQYSGSLDSISLRGNTTTAPSKKPYGIELSKSASLCGMDAGKKWKLLALYFEQDKIHSKMIFDMARKIGLTYTPDSSWVDLYCNGEYQGLYLLTETVTSNLDHDDGYLIEKTGKKRIVDDDTAFSTKLGYYFFIKKPGDLSDAQVTEIEDYVRKVESLIISGDTSYKEYIDIDSIAKQFLIDKIVLEVDAMDLSLFFYIKENKLYAGPLWDYDRSMGEAFPDYAMPIEGFPNGMPEWYMALYQDEDFLRAMKEAYCELLPYCKQLLQTDIDKYAEEISASVAMDSVLMAKEPPIAGRMSWLNYREHKNYVRYLKYYFANRLNFLNNLWGISDWGFELPASTEEYHTVIFQLADGTVVETQEVMDGEYIAELPILNEPEPTVWYYLYRNGEFDKPYYSKLPVYEDIVLYANK